MESLRVLICDDEMGMRTGVVRVLRRFILPLPEIDVEVQFEIEQAETGEEAVEKIMAEPPDILLLDHKLPGMTGLDVLEKLHEDEVETGAMLTVMITAYASLDTAVTAIKRGAYDFLPKPFTPKDLKGTIRKAAATLMHERQARKLAEEKRQVRFQFISVLSHELKAPINGVEGFLEIIKDKTLGEDLPPYMELIDRCLIRLEHMKKLIFDLLDMTRIESGQKQRDIQPIDIISITRTAIETSSPLAEQRGITIHLEGPESFVFPADSGELEIILNNLVSNAVKYNRENGTVTITYAPKGDLLELWVKDTGIGMTQAECDKLFQDFVRIKNSKTKGISGTGLGLSTMKKLIQLYNGTVTISSEPDVGTTFHVTLDITSAAPPSGASDA